MPPRRHAQTDIFRRHVQTTQHRQVYLSCPLPAAPRAWGEDTDVYRLPLELTFPEDPVYGSGFRESTICQKTSFTAVPVFSDKPE